MDPSNKVSICPLPLYHIFGLTFHILTFVNCGWKAILVTNPKDQDEIIKPMGVYQPGFMIGVNSLYNNLLNNPSFHKLNFSKTLVSISGGMALQSSVA